MSKEDFISKLKKMKSDSKSPSVIAETLEKIEALEKQNIELKEKIDKNVEIVHDSEQIIKKTVGEKDQLKEDITQKNELITTLENKIKTLESQVNTLTNDNEALKSELNSKLAEAQKELKEHAAPTVDKELVDNLTSELSKKKSQIIELQNTIKSLTEENEKLNKQLTAAKEKDAIDYIAPVEGTGKPETTSASTKTLEILVQDLQSDMNRYKRIIEKLKKENTDLKEAQEISGTSAEVDKIKELKKENEILKEEISKLEKLLEKEAIVTSEAVAAETKVKELEDELKEKEKLIRELETSKTAEIPMEPGGPMSGLIEDLQGKINKLKLALKEKNKIIEDLQKN
ncbi:MAG: hypothetical protein ACFFAH_10655 [Promethearchaeota archaeon]